MILSFSKKHSTIISNTAYLILVFTLSLKPIVDTDFGWHLRTGQWIIQNHQIPTTDLFSHSNPTSPYIYHSWLMEVAYSIYYQAGGLWAISLFLATLTTLGYFFLAKSTTKPHNLFFLLAATITIFPLTTLTGTTARTQAITFTLLSVLHYFLQKLSTKWSSIYGFFIVFLFILWANSHGGFTLGLAFFAIYLITFLFTHPPTHKNLSILSRLTITLFISTAATLINPYFFKLHTFTYQMFTNPTARQFNLDWIPHHLKGAPVASLHFALTIILSLLVLTNHKTTQQNKILLAFYLFTSLFLPRLTLLLFIILIPNLPTAITHILPTKNKLKPVYSTSFATILIAFSLILGAKDLQTTFTAHQNLKSYSQISQKMNINYPHDTLIYLKNHGFTPQLLNNINWGGYLVWQMPDIKIFADGKMDNYFTNNQSFLTTYRQIVLTQPGWQQLLDDYQINTVYTQPNEPIAKQLTQDPNWNTITQDEISIILERIDPI